MTVEARPNRSTITVNDTQVEVYSAGAGPALLYLHGPEGSWKWKPFHEELARTHKVYVPSMPGFNGTQRPGWVATITDVAHFMQHVGQTLGLDRYILMGASMGGWVAAEMAAMSHPQLSGLVLVDPAGIKPQKKEIAEIFMVGADTREKLRFHAPSQVDDYGQYIRALTEEETDIEYSNREMASRICWRPYMHNPSLPHYLKKVTTPTLIIWGRQDAIIPVECGELYKQALDNASLTIIDNCGHSPHYEKPQEFHAAVGEFLDGLK